MARISYVVSDRVRNAFTHQASDLDHVVLTSDGAYSSGGSIMFYIPDHSANQGNKDRFVAWSYQSPSGPSDARYITKEDARELVAFLIKQFRFKVETKRDVETTATAE